MVVKRHGTVFSSNARHFDPGADEWTVERQDNIIFVEPEAFKLLEAVFCNAFHVIPLHDAVTNVFVSEQTDTFGNEPFALECISILHWSNAAKWLRFFRPGFGVGCDAALGSKGEDGLAEGHGGYKGERSTLNV